MTNVNSVETAMASDLEVMAQANNYRDWMHRRIEPFIGRRVLEVGAGIGNFTQLLLDRELVVPTDISRVCLSRLEERLGDRLRARPRLLDLGAPSDEDWAAYAFDTIICMNVLEHVEDDAAALSFMREVLVPGGRAVILVPAFMFLHGTIDKAIGHYRPLHAQGLAAADARGGLRGGAQLLHERHRHGGLVLEQPHPQDHGGGRVADRAVR
ncbi:MAG: class I SAM-dependent methyltransferase [Acidobacteria bacterium]|nr:class I SAM-dependent methyltransferase [Acidobacteriota bacterium]